MQKQVRLVDLTGAFNFRDLGGYSGFGGRPIRWGRLFRSDSLHALTGQDVESIAALGLETIIDLRTDGELTSYGRGSLAAEPINFRHLPVVGIEAGEAVGAPAPPGEELSHRYGQYLEEGRQALVDALSTMTEAANLPLVFHCAAGKDRTGVLAALVLDIVGVDHSVIVDDYVITASRIDLIAARYVEGLDPAMVASVPAYYTSVEGKTMEQFLARLSHQYGGARGWAVQSGISAEALDQMVELLLEAEG